MGGQGWEGVSPGAGWVGSEAVPLVLEGKACRTATFGYGGRGCGLSPLYTAKSLLMTS